MTADSKLFNVHTEEVAASLWAEADAHARAEVIAWLVPQLTDAYRAAVLRRLDDASGEGSAEGIGAATRVVSPTDAGEGIYVYGITDAGLPQELERISGIEGSAVTLVIEGGLAALSSTVRLAGFEAAQESPDVSEHSWLATAIRAHEGVVESACGRTTVLPMRFGTVYPGLSEVAAFLAEHADVLTDELGRLRGCTEWGAKLRVDRDAAFRGARHQDADLDAAAEAANAASEGTAWMLRRQLAARTYQTLGRHVRACVDAVHDGLAACALDSVVSTTGNGDNPGGVVLNASYLVNDPDAFHRCADELRTRFRDDGVRLQTTGPWPTYHFVRLPELAGRHD